MRHFSHLLLDPCLAPAGEWVAAVRRLLPGGGGECPHLYTVSPSAPPPQLYTAHQHSPTQLNYQYQKFYRMQQLALLEGKRLLNQIFCLGTLLSFITLQQDNFDYFIDVSLYQVHLLVLFCLFICSILNNVNILNFIDIQSRWMEWFHLL